MSRLLDLQGELQDASASIAQFEKAIAIAPNSPSVSAMLKSFQKRKLALEQEFQKLITKVRADLCRYRFFSDTSPATAAAIGAGLVDFQKMFSLAFDAIKNGPRKKTRLTPQLQEQSAFHFGYTFSGSVGIVLTIEDKQRDLFGSDLNSAMEALACLGAARTKEQVIEMGKRLGAPSVNAMYQWASAHIKSGLGADIEWQQDHEIKTKMLLQLSDLRAIVEAIDKTNQTFDEELEIEAQLVGADTVKRSFHLKLSDGTELLGSLADTISSSRRFEVNAPHLCTVRKRVRVFYSTLEEEDVSHQLVSATMIEANGHDRQQTLLNET